MNPVRRSAPGRLPVPAPVLAPIVVLVFVVTLGVAGRLAASDPTTATAAPTDREPRDSRRADPEPAFVRQIAGLSVLSVDEAVERVRAEPNGTLIAVGGWVTVPPESSGCEAPAGRSEPTWIVLCWRGAVLSGDHTPVLDARGRRLPAGSTAARLPSEVMPGAAIATSIVERVGERRLLQPIPVIALGRPLDRSSTRTFAIERVVDPSGKIDNRITRRDPDLGYSTLPRAELEAAVDTVVRRSPVVLRQVFVRDADVRYLDAAAPPGDGPGKGVWFVSALGNPGEESPGISWLVVDDATGAVLASGPVNASGSS